MKRILLVALSIMLLCTTACDSQEPVESAPTSESTSEPTESESKTTFSTQLEATQSETSMSKLQTDKTTTKNTTISSTSSKSTSTTPESTTAKTSLLDQPYIPTVPISNLAANQRQLIPDNEFYYGMTVRSQKDHNNGDAFSDLGHFRYLTQNGTPSWIIAQWDSGPCLWKDRVASAANVLTDGKSKWVTYLENGGISLRLNSAPYYADKPNQAAAAGDYWPHLLLEAPDFGYSSIGKRERAWYHCDMDDLTLSFDMRLSAYSYTPNSYDYVYTCQYMLYFYIKGVESPDFVWFGIRPFCSEQENTGLYMAMDGGKADASGQLIYLIGSTECFAGADGSLFKNGKPAPGEDWVHIEMDLTKHLKEMFTAAQEKGYFSDKVQSLADLKIDGMNIGFESTGTYDATMDIHNLSLISTREQ